jgi:hypothetical protein
MKFPRLTAKSELFLVLLILAGAVEGGRWAWKTVSAPFLPKPEPTVIAARPPTRAPAPTAAPTRAPASPTAEPLESYVCVAADTPILDEAFQLAMPVGTLPAGQCLSVYHQYTAEDGVHFLQVADGWVLGVQGQVFWLDRFDRLNWDAFYLVNFAPPTPTRGNMSLRESFLAGTPFFGGSATDYPRPWEEKVPDDPRSEWEKHNPPDD